MRTQVLVLLMVGLGALMLVPYANGVDRTRSPRCAIKNPVPPVHVMGPPDWQFIGGEFHNRCLDAVAEMGVYACLEELEDPFARPRIIECFVNRDKPVFLAPHTTSVYMAAECRFTSIRRWYQMSGYGWAISLSQLPYRSPEYRTRLWTTPATGSRGVSLMCDIAGPAGVRWRDSPWHLD